MPNTNKTCDTCEGTGIAENALGELERCAPCRGAGTTSSAPEPYHVAWREPLRREPSEAEAAWSPYPWGFGRHRDYYDRDAAW